MKKEISTLLIRIKQAQEKCRFPHISTMLKLVNASVALSWKTVWSLWPKVKNLQKIS